MDLCRARLRAAMEVLDVRMPVEAPSLSVEEFPALPAVPLDYRAKAREDMRANAPGSFHRRR